MKSSRFGTFAWFVLIYNLFVIIWGGYVRASGSGAGCGAHWPVCNGELIPREPELETLIEYSHRLTSGLALLLLLALVIWAFRAFPARHRVRRAAVAAGVFMLIEAAIGAGLVLLELVAYSEEVARAYWMVGHLMNTFLLMAALALVAWWGSGKEGITLRGQGIITTSFWVAFAGMLVLGASGGIAALGDTLALGGGISPAESAVVATLVELRIWHPIIAIVAGALVVWFGWEARRRRTSVQTVRLSTMLFVLYGAQLLLGSLNVALKAPVWLQMVHLLMTNLIWVTFILLGAAALSRSLLNVPPNVRNYPVGQLTTGKS